MSKKTTKVEESKPEKVASSFSKEQLLSSKRFQDRRDILNAVLKPDKQYTVEAVPTRCVGHIFPCGSCKREP